MADVGDEVTAHGVERAAVRYVVDHDETSGHGSGERRRRHGEHPSWGSIELYRAARGTPRHGLGQQLAYGRLDERLTVPGCDEVGC